MGHVIGQKIKEARLKAGLTQKELSERLGISAAAVNKFERRQTPPSISTLERVAKAIGCTLVIDFN
ncbi:helix-turn-helix domain-containing protein [Spirosoma sp. HMF4905]|uniref:Helix-turn-helix domain-containing protein n=1 Tax=Spirosoma arboris TaxID=2682092 RepID=A0A7K1SJ94_9BACT|nr:helix-turn-helix transcriptional regulator [Spirosoma arboris]MVM33833.1 helix-turn-helix domain-containing protein [Spirosoma arboris]